MDLGWFELSLPVKDLDRSVGFYETLGFEVVARQPGKPWAILQSGDCRIGLFQNVLDPDRPQLIFWQGDVDEIRRSLERRGIGFEKTPSEGDGRGGTALLRDPDGHPICFINLPGETRKGPPLGRPSPAPG